MMKEFASLNYPQCSLWCFLNVDVTELFRSYFCYEKSKWLEDKRRIDLLEEMGILIKLENHLKSSFKSDRLTWI